MLELSDEITEFLLAETVFSAVMGDRLAPIVSSADETYPFANYVVREQTGQSLDGDAYSVTLLFYFEQNNYRKCVAFLDQMKPIIKEKYDWLNSEIEFVEVDQSFVGIMNFNANGFYGNNSDPIITDDVPVVTSAGLININTGQTLEYFITATNTPTKYGASGIIGNSFNVDSATGRIVGIPMDVGTFEIVLNAENGAGIGYKTLTIVVAESIDISPPTIPANLTFDTNIIDPSNSSLRKFTLRWDASQELESSVAGYDISINGLVNYYTFAPGLNLTSFIVEGKAPATTYLVKIKARNVFSNVSAFSNEISVTTI